MLLIVTKFTAFFIFACKIRSSNFMTFILSKAGLRPLPRGYEVSMGYLGRGYRAGNEDQIDIRTTPEGTPDPGNGVELGFEIKKLKFGLKKGKSMILLARTHCIRFPSHSFKKIRITILIAQGGKRR
ncbi:MAG: hypothetical protein GY874_11680 [Desulfobacteraceae bacterium]|nr:hypothetical protein [Desulfobacteraceae bacterium]